MNRNLSSTKKGMKDTIRVFDPNLDPKKYDKKNLRQFIAMLSPVDQERYDNAETEWKKNIRNELLQREGYSRNDIEKYDRISAVSPKDRNPSDVAWFDNMKKNFQTVTKRSDYNNATHEKMWNYVNALHKQGKLVPIPDNYDPSKNITLNVVNEFLAESPRRDEIVAWVQDTPANQFNVNALEAVARNLGLSLKGVSEHKGADKRQYLHDIITGKQSDGSVSESGRNNLLSYLQKEGIRSHAQLLASPKDLLSMIAKSAGLSSGGTKVKLAGDIAKVANFQLVPDVEDIQNRWRELLGQKMTQTELLAQVRRDRILSADALERLSVDNVKNIYKTLGLSGQSSKSKMISDITGTESAIARSRSSRTTPVFDMRTCSAMSEAQLSSIIDNYKLFSHGLSQKDMCDLVVGRNMMNTANKFMNNFQKGYHDIMGNNGSGSRLDALSRASGIPGKHITDLLPEFIRSLYLGKAYFYSPEVADQVEAFLLNGTLPQVVSDGFAKVFADISPGIVSSNPQNRKSLLNNARKEFILPALQDKDPQKVYSNLPVYGFNTSNRSSLPSPQVSNVSVGRKSRGNITFDSNGVVGRDNFHVRDTKWNRNVLNNFSTRR